MSRKTSAGAALDDAESLLRPRSILRAAVPLLAGLLLEQVIGLTDVLFLGRYGEAELAAAGVSGIWVMLLMMVGLGYATGAQSLMSRANGAGRLGEVASTLRQAALFLVIVGAVAAVGSALLFEPLVGRTLSAPEVSRAARDYALWRTAALPAAWLGFLVRSFFVSILRPGVLTVSSIVMVVVNCSLNALLIFGIGPFPELGITGAAVASAISELAALGVLVGRLALDRGWLDRCRGRLADWRMDGAAQGRLFALGRWMMLQEAVAFGVWIYFFVAVEHAAGERGLALSNVVRQLGALLFLFVHAFGTTCGAIAANLEGAGDARRVPEVVKTGLLVCGCAMLPACAAFLAFPDAVLGMLTDIPEVIEDAKPAYFVMTVSYLLTMPAYFLFFILIALGCVKESFRITMISTVAYWAYVTLLAATTTNTAVLWTSDAAYGFVLGAGAWLVWRRRMSAQRA